jgi:nitrate/nitrite transporter NarK
LSGTLTGIAGAIGAVGGVLVNLALRQSFLDTRSGDLAYVAFLIYYAVCFALTWWVYLRPSHRLAATPEPAPEHPVFERSDATIRSSCRGRRGV